MSYRSLRFAFLAAPFLLAACGEGYELVKVNDVFPYGNERTAGSAYAYVLEGLMPERELNLEPISEPVVEAPEPVAEVVEPAPAEPPALQETKEILEDLETDLDEVFEESQRK